MSIAICFRSYALLGTPHIKNTQIVTRQETDQSMITLVFANRVTTSESGLVDQLKDFPGFYQSVTTNPRDL